MDRLVQRRLLRKRTVVLEKDCIRVIDRTLMETVRYEVAYEVLFGDRIDLRSSAIWALATWAFTGFAVLVGAWSYLTDSEKDMDVGLLAMFAVVSILSGAYFWATRRRPVIGFVDSKNQLYLQQDLPSTEAVDELLDEARRRARARLRAKLLPLAYTDDEAANRDFALYLRDKGIISAEEYSDYVSRREPPPERPAN